MARPTLAKIILDHVEHDILGNHLIGGGVRVSMHRGDTITFSAGKNVDEFARILRKVAHGESQREVFAAITVSEIPEHTT